jgi:hypothetical protein
MERKISQYKDTSKFVFIKSFFYYGLYEFSRELNMTPENVLLKLQKFNIEYPSNCDVVIFKTREAIEQAEEWINSVLIANLLAGEIK